jgi:protein-disulfide isomerase
MRYYWQFLLVTSLIGIFICLFFVFSLSTKNKITFTDDNLLTAPAITIADPSLGPTNASITLVNYGDYQCPSCGDLDQTLNVLREEYGDQIRIVWKDMPNTSAHDQAMAAAIAARCAGEQKKFWEYHTLLMANQSILGPELYTQLATTLELKDKQFARCLEDQTTLPLVQRSFEEGVALGITATPTLYINGQRQTGSTTITEIRKIINAVNPSF